MAQSIRGPPHDRVVGPALQHGLQAGPGLLETAQAGRQVGTREPQPIVIRLPLDLGQISFERDGLEVESDVLAEQGESGISAPRSRSRSAEVIPTDLDQPTGIVEATLLAEQAEQLVAEIRVLRPGPTKHPREDLFGFGELSQPEGHPGALQGDAAGQGRRLGRPRPGDQRPFGSVTRQLATAEVEGDFAVIRPLLRQSSEAMPGGLEKARVQIATGLIPLRPQPTRGQGPSGETRQDQHGQEPDAPDHESPTSHLHGLALRWRRGYVPRPNFSRPT